MLKPAIKTVLFDFDYTLADSSDGVIDCINHALTQLQLPTQAAQKIRSTIGLSLPDTLAELIGHLPLSTVKEFRRHFVKQADQVMADKTILLPGVQEVLDVLQSRNLTLGLVSTKFRYRIQTILEREHLLDYFAVIIGGEDVTRHKPNPEGLLLAVERLNSTPDSTLYVGDSVTDAKTAQKAGVPFVAVLSGVTPAEAFAAYPVERIITNLSELLKIF